MTSIGTVGITDLPKLTRAYNKAVKDNKEQFDYNGHSLLVSYAKYLILYLKSIKK